MVFSTVLTAHTSLADDLYRAESFRPLASDRKGFRPGDLLTVLVVENASATASADTTTQKKGAIGLGLKTPSIDKSASLEASDDFTGQGRIQRSGRLLAQISVRIQSVDEAGLLWVAGQQVIDVNGEKQEIELSGRVRRSDIQDNNSVLSTRIADAHIRYVGDGILAEKQHPGILTRILSWLGFL